VVVADEAVVMWNQNCLTCTGQGGRRGRRRRRHALSKLLPPERYFI
jgi:hypothetical protein